MFEDSIKFGDEMQHALACAYCGAPASRDHICEGKQKAEEQSNEEGSETVTD